jgi:hypothetical protein
MIYNGDNHNIIGGINNICVNTTYYQLNIYKNKIIYIYYHINGDNNDNIDSNISVSCYRLEMIY